MSGRQSEAATRGLELIAQGVTLREAARIAGVAPSTLIRARKRSGLEPLKRGRPVTSLAEPGSA